MSVFFLEHNTTFRFTKMSYCCWLQNFEVSAEDSLYKNKAPINKEKAQEECNEEKSELRRQ